MHTKFIEKLAFKAFLNCWKLGSQSPSTHGKEHTSSMYFFIFILAKHK